MAGTFKNRKLFLAYSPIFKKQSAWDMPLANADISSRHPQDTPTFPVNQFTREETRDCNGEYVIFEEITSRLKRLQFGFYPNGQIAAGWLALAMGAAASPTGAAANEIQTITSTATGGTFKVTFTFEGVTDSVDIPYNATASAIEGYLQTLRSIRAGNVTCAGTLGAGVACTFGNALGNASLPEMTIDNTNATGGTASVAQTTAGNNYLHAITRSSSDQPPQTSIIYGFEGDTTNPVKGKNVVVNSWKVSGTVRGKVLCEIDLLFSGEVDEALAYTVPDCVNFQPIKAADVRLDINGTYYTQNLREFSYEYSNNILTGDDPFPFDGIDAVRLERGDRTSSFMFQIFGSRGDALYTLVDSEAVEDVTLHVGGPGNRVSVYAPSTKLKFADAGIIFSGEANRSALSFTGTPFKSATAGTPDYAEGRNSQSTAYLT